jgi:hypothetical protein
MTGWCSVHSADPVLLPHAISWYEDFPCLPGRARHAQFARLRGAEHIATPPQCPGTGGGKVARLRDS